MLILLAIAFLPKGMRMMATSGLRVLLAHNYYGSDAPSGENQAFLQEAAMLRGRGHAVDTFVRHSDEIRHQGTRGTIRGAFATPWNPWMSRLIRNKVRNFHPTIVHVHNTFPLLSPAIFAGVGTRAAKVLTLHNYRLFCAAAIVHRASKAICTECLDQHSILPSLRYGCYRESRAATLPIALAIGLQRLLGTWNRHVDIFITLTEFQRDLMIRAGLSANRVVVKPNFVFQVSSPVNWDERENVAVYAGRLTKEKGVETLVRAWRRWGSSAPELRLLGDGPLRRKLERMATGARITVMGQVPPDLALRQIARAKLMVLAAEWYECFPMVIVEAFASGTPAAVSNVGPLPSIVDHRSTGLVFRMGDDESIVKEIRAVWDVPGGLRALGTNARKCFVLRYTEEKNYQGLMDIYERALNEHVRRLK
jgi:glycosyltransferase involved in cell wall biosynthesis